MEKGVLKAFEQIWGTNELIVRHDIPVCFDGVVPF